MSHDYLFKFIVTGDSSVGKTALLRRFSDSKFLPEFEATVGIDFKTKQIQVEDKDILLMIWDSAGQETYRSFTRSYYRGSAVVLLVYDVTSQNSFKSIPRWLQDARKNCVENPCLGIVLVGNKADLEEQRQVSEDEGRAFATENDLMFFETSAKENLNVSDLFVEAASHFYQKYKNGLVDITTDSHGLTLGPKRLRSGSGSCYYC